MKKSGAEPVDRLVLDTSAYSRFRASHPVAAQFVALAHVVLLPVTVIGELEAAFIMGSRTAENRLALADFLAEQFVFALDTTTGIARRYGDLIAKLRRAGTPIPANDVWIAAATLDSGGHLLTFDSDFDRVDGLPHTLVTG